MGMQTFIGEGASTISGGQRQRLMIARAIVTKPRIILFDEATSSMDNQTQSVVSDSLAQLNVTRVVIAQRLSTVLKADKIYVIDAGRVVETGTYQTLMAQNGLFASMTRRQLA
jgi:ABC-type bacteriocin/lantibiotic exporter with double-glycine peptidase domain